MATVSNQDQRWRGWLRTFSITLATLSLLTYAAIVLIDPHDHLAVSWPAQRAPINGNQRFSYPAIARSGRYDSLVIGTSTTRMLVPERLNAALGGRFANLSMNSATAWEQSRLLEVYVRATADRSRPFRQLLIGMDASWCDPAETLQEVTFRTFPRWLYDSNPFNDYLQVFNARTIEQAARQVQYWRGRLQPRYGFDGYRDFLPPAGSYDLARARQHIYGSEQPRRRVPPAAPQYFDSKTRAAWPYAALRLLPGILESLPQQTRVLMVFVPYHRYAQPLAGTAAHARWQECKRRVTTYALARDDSHVIDFMIDSAITREDRNYWDSLHYTAEIGHELVRLMAAVLEQGRGIEDRVELLTAR
ncbi:MAG: hypothetical protein KDK91_09200 [Gammaproteobacteria bacterium]|nr:hypothetical protein [Gammaproteobacteria bacterium]